MPQGDLRWARPGERTFAMAIREKYPDDFSDVPDHALEGIFTARYPGDYDDIPRTVPPGQTAEGLEQYQKDRASEFRPRRTVGGTLKDLLVTAGSQTVGALYGTPVALADIATSIAGRGTPVGDFVASTPTPGYSQGASIQERQRLFESFYSPAQQYESREVGEAEGVRETLEAVRRNPSVIPHAVVGSIPHMLGSAGIARGLLKVAGRVAPRVAAALRPVAPAVGEGTVSGAQTAAQIRDQAGELTPGQAALAVGSGALTAVLTRIGGLIAREMGVADIDSVLAGVQTNSGLRRNVVQRMLAGAVQEGVLEELPQSMQEQIAQNMATGQPLDTGVSQAGVLGLITGGIFGLGAQAGSSPTPPPLVRLEMAARGASVANETANYRRQALIDQDASSAAIDQAVEDAEATFEAAREAIIAWDNELERLGLPTTQETLSDPDTAPSPDGAEAAPGQPVAPVVPAVPPQGPGALPLPTVAPATTEAVADEAVGGVPIPVEMDTPAAAGAATEVAQPQAEDVPVPLREVGSPRLPSPGARDDGTRPRARRPIGTPGPGAGLGAQSSTRAVRVASIIEDLRVGLGGIPLNVEGATPQGAEGVYRSPDRSILMRWANDLDTYLHEAGHDMDMSLLQIPRRKQPWTGELLELGDPTSSGKTQTERLREGAAGFFRLYLVDPAEAQALAPVYFKEFERKLSKYPQADKVLKQAQADIKRVQGFTPQERIDQRVQRNAASMRERVMAMARAPVQNLLYDNQVTVLEERLLIAKTSTEREAIEEEIKTIQNRRLGRPLATIAQRVAIDDLVGLKQAVMTMAAGHPLATTENAYVMARLARGAGAMAAGFVESDQGVTLADGTSLGPSLKQALEPVLGAFEKEGQELFEDYLIALRVQELHGRRRASTDGPPNLGITLSEAQEYIQEVEQRPDFAAFEKARDAVYAHQDAVLEYAIHGKLLTQEQADKIRKVNRFYVPFNRSQDERVGAGLLGGAAGLSGARRGLADQRAPLYKIGESTRDLLPPLQQIIANDFAWVSAVEQNRAMLALTDQAAGRRRGQRGVTPPDSARWMEREADQKAATEFAGEQLKPVLTRRMKELGIDLPPAELDSLLDVFVTVFTPTQPRSKGDNLVSVMKNGKREYWRVHDASLLNAIAAVGPKDVSRWMQWAQAPARLLRAGATLAPGFILRNPARDTLVAWVQSRHGFLPVVDTVIGLYEQFRPESVARDLFFRNGIAQATLAGNDRANRDAAIKNLGKSGLQRVVQNPIDLMRALSSQMEVASRLGEFKLALEAGGQERGVLERLFGPKLDPSEWDENVVATAALAARDVTTDFQRAGSWSREINRWDAFFNAQVQGVSRMVETAQRDPVGMSMKLGLMGLMSTALWFGNAEDDEYQELPEWEKHIYWHVKLPGNTTWFRIPKPFDYGYVADFTEAALDLVAKEDPTRLRQIKDQFVGESWGTSAANLIPSVVLPLLEVWANYNSFRDTDIIRQWDLGLDTDLQYNDFTSDTAKVLGKIVPVAPANLDHLIFGYSASLGRIAVGAADLALRSLGIADPSRRPDRQMQQQPVIGNFLRTRSFGASSRSIQDIYDFSTAVTDYEASRRVDSERGDDARARRRLEEHTQAWWWPRRRLIAAERKKFTALGQRIREIYEAPPSRLTSQQKREQLDRIYESMARGAARALGRPMTETE
jgi:hypothetical protein